MNQIPVINSKSDTKICWLW